MQGLFESLSRGIEGAPGVALAVASLWGVLSIVLSPCHLASIPLIVGFMSGETDLSPRRAYAISLSFALGILTSIVAVGALTAGAGTLLGDVGNWTNYAVALVFFVIGLHLLGVIDLPNPDAAKVRSSRRGPGAAFLLGAVFGIALGPCTFAYMTPVLTASLKAASTAPALAVGLLFAYGVGHCAVIVAAGGSVPLTQQILAWNGESKSSVVLRRVSGGLVIIGGLYLLWTAR